MVTEEELKEEARDTISKEEAPYNAECLIDYENKKVEFSYPQEISRRNNWVAYENHIVPHTLGLLLALSIFFIAVTPVLYPITVVFAHWIEFYSNSTTILSVACTTYIFGWLIIWKLWTKICLKATGSVSVLLHHNSKYLRKIYPKSNAVATILLKKLKNSKEYFNFDFKDKEEEIIREEFVWINNKLIIYDYDIVLTEYKLTGQCSKLIKKIYSVCTCNDEEERKSPLVNEFALVFEFSKRPTSGRVTLT